MEISVTEAKARLTNLVRRIGAGDEVIPTRHGHAAVRLTPVRPVRTPEARRAAIEQARASAREHATPGLDAPRSQDFLFDEDGLPA